MDTISYEGPNTLISTKSFGKDAKGFTIGKRRDDPTQKSPGPGEYNPERSISATKERTRDYSFSKTQKSNEKVQDNVGPGYYDKERFYR